MIKRTKRDILFERLDKQPIGTGITVTFFQPTTLKAYCYIWLKEQREKLIFRYSFVKSGIHVRKELKR